MEERPLVTIACPAFNEEEFISDTIEGFLRQKTTFPVEIIINDDCSSDGTAKIIEEYAKKYPGIIIPIFQKKNLFSSGVSILHDVILPMARGKYIATCEGDDFWIDENKLQIQIDFLEANPDYSLVGHSFQTVSENGTKILATIHPTLGDGDISTESFIEHDFSKMFHFASCVWRTDLLKAMPPVFRRAGSSGDYSKWIYFSLVGKVRCIDKVMSNYRIRETGSWTKKMKKDGKYAVDHYTKALVFLDKLDQYTDGKYIENTNARRDYYCFKIDIANLDFKQARKRNIYKSLSKKRKIVLSLGVLFPRLAGKLYNSK